MFTHVVYVIPFFSILMAVCSANENLLIEVPVNLFISHWAFLAEKLLCADFEGSCHKDELEKQREQGAIVPLSACRN